MNGPLQQRTRVLDSDWAAATSLPSDYETDLEENENVQSAFSSSLETRNLFEQKQLAERVNREMNELISLVTRSLNFRLNVEQHFTVDSPAVFMSLERLTTESLSNKEIQMVGNAFLRLPSTLNISLNDTSSPSLRVRLFWFFSLSNCFRLVRFGTTAFSRSIDRVDEEFVSIDFIVISR